MSYKETKRRKIARQVMLQAWKTYRRNLTISFSLALKASWSIVRILTTFSHNKVELALKIDNKS